MLIIYTGAESFSFAKGLANTLGISEHSIKRLSAMKRETENHFSINENFSKIYIVALKTNKFCFDSLGEHSPEHYAFRFAKRFPNDHTKRQVKSIYLFACHAGLGSKGTIAQRFAAGLVSQGFNATLQIHTARVPDDITQTAEECYLIANKILWQSISQTSSLNLINNFNDLENKHNIYTAQGPLIRKTFSYTVAECIQHLRNIENAPNSLKAFCETLCEHTDLTSNIIIQIILTLENQLNTIGENVFSSSLLHLIKLRKNFVQKLSYSEKENILINELNSYKQTRAAEGEGTLLSGKYTLNVKISAVTTLLQDIHSKNQNSTLTSMQKSALNEGRLGEIFSKLELSLEEIYAQKAVPQSIIHYFSFWKTSPPSPIADNKKEAFLTDFYLKIGHTSKNMRSLT